MARNVPCIFFSLINYLLLYKENFQIVKYISLEKRSSHRQHTKVIDGVAFADV